MKHRIAALERRFLPQQGQQDTGIVAIIADDGAICENGHKHANEGAFERFCAKMGIQTILFLPDNGRDKLTK